MSGTVPYIEPDDLSAETKLLSAAVAVSDADPRTVPHERVRAWLLALAEGDFDAPPPDAE